MLLFFTGSDLTPCCLIDGDPSYAFPLGVCQGDCDSTNDCAPGLVCFERTNYQAVPGCCGGEYDSTANDYCVPGLPTHRPTPRPTERPTPQPTSRPTKRPTRPTVVTPVIGYVGNGTYYSVPQ